MNQQSLDKVNPFTKVRTLRGGRLTKWKGKVASIAHVVGVATVFTGLSVGTASAANECGPSAAGPTTIICGPANYAGSGTYPNYPTGILYTFQDSLTLTLNDADATLSGNGIRVYSTAQNTGDIVVVGERFSSISTTGYLGRGVWASSFGPAGDAHASMSENAGSVQTTGSFAYGILAQIENASNSGNVSAIMNGGSIETAGYASGAIYAYSEGLGSATSVMSNGIISTTGLYSDGLFSNITISGNLADATATLIDGDITTAGQYSSGVGAATIGFGNVTTRMDAGSISTRGAESYGLLSLISNADSTAEARTTLMTGEIVTAGEGSHGLYALNNGSGGAVAQVSGGSIATVGTNASGIFAQSDGGMFDVNANAGTVTSGTGAAAGIRTLAAAGGSINIAAAATIDGAASGKAIRDGDLDNDGIDEIGGDVVVTTAGIVTGDAILGIGDDALNLTGGTFTGTIYGDDLIASIDDGDDTFNWSAGTLVGGFRGQDGSDTALVTATAYDGTQVFDGGDDYSTADGFTDVLTLQGTSASTIGANLLNWERITVDGGALAIIDGALEVGSDAGMGLMLANAAVLNAESGLLLTGNLSNEGTITMQDGTVGDAVNVSGDYSGDGSLLVDADFASGTSDTLVVGGDISGVTQLDVSDVSGGASTGNDITVVKVSGSASENSFALAGGTLVAGAFDYGLAYDPGAVVLRSLGVNGTGAVYEALPAILSGFNRMSTLEQRVGQRQWTDADTSGEDIQPSGTWLRLHGSNTNLVADSGTTSSINSWGMQAGIDFNVEEGETGNWVLGVTGQYASSNASVANALGFGDIDSEGYGLGLTATWYGNTGTYFDAQGQVNWISSDLSSSAGGSLATDQDSTAYALSAEVGHLFEMSETATLVPQAQLVWGQVDGASFTDSAGNAVDLGSNDSLVGRLGLAYEYESLTADGDKQMIYTIANVLHDFSGSNSVNVAGANLSSDTSETWGEIGLGGSFAWDDSKSLYGEASYRQALGNSDSNALGVTAGLRVQW